MVLSKCATAFRIFLKESNPSACVGITVRHASESATGKGQPVDSVLALEMPLKQSLLVRLSQQELKASEATVKNTCQ